MMTAVNAGARLDRLPIGPFHRRILWLVGLGMFFDSFDNTLSGAVLGELLHSGWSTLQLNSLFMSATFIGLTIGAGAAGWLSDQFGRRFAYQFNLAIFGTMALLAAMAPSMHSLIAIRGIMGLGLGAEYVMCYGLIIEFMPPEKRGKYLGYLALFAGAGVFVPAGISTFVIPYLGWRFMFLIGAVGAIWVWWLRRHMPESPRWLEKMGRGEEAEAVLQDIEKEAAHAGPLPPVKTAPQSASSRIPLSVLFSRSVLRRTVLALVLNVGCLFGSYSLTGWMPTFFVSQGMTVTKSLAFNAAMMAGWIIGPLLCVLLADRIGRRWGLVAFGLLCAVIGTTYPFLTEPVAIILCGMLMMSTVAIMLVLGLGYVPELFPTEYRFRGSGLAQMVGRAGLIISPFIVLTLFQGYGINGVIAAIAGMYLVIALLLAFAGVETNRRSLEDLDSEAVVDGQAESMPAVHP